MYPYLIKSKYIGMHFTIKWMYNIDHLDQLILLEDYFGRSNQEIEIMSLINEP
jgi:hypothetical protein